MFHTIWKHRGLISQLTKREVQNRYRGSFLGIFWSFLTPLFMLFVYTLIFSSVFKMQWAVDTENEVQFAMILFCGLTVFNIFAEALGRSPGIILSNPNYVKRVVFPLEILPVTILLSSMINGLIGLVMLLVVDFVLNGQIFWTVFYYPLVILPLLLITLGISWFLSSIGVYLRDIGQIVPIVISALLFLSPIFYPLSVVPKEIQFLYVINPLSYTIEDARQTLIWGRPPNWYWIGIGSVVGFVISILGYFWFQKTKKGFADVI